MGAGCLSSARFVLDYSHLHCAGDADDWLCGSRWTSVNRKTPTAAEQSRPEVSGDVPD